MGAGAGPAEAENFTLAVMWNFPIDPARSRVISAMYRRFFRTVVHIGGDDECNRWNGGPDATRIEHYTCFGTLMARCVRCPPMPFAYTPHAQPRPFLVWCRCASLPARRRAGRVPCWYDRLECARNVPRHVALPASPRAHPVPTSHAERFAGDVFFSLQ